MLKQYLHTTVFSAIKVASAFLLLYLLGQNLSPQQFGVYSLISSTVTLGVYALGMDLYTYLMRWVPGSPAGERHKLLKTILVFEMVVAGLGILLVILLGLDQRLAFVLNIGESWRLYRAGLLLLLMALCMRELIRYLYAVKRIETGNVLEFVGASSYVYVLALMWVVWESTDLLTVLSLWGLALFAAVSYGLAKVDAGQLMRVSMDGGVLRAAFSFSGPLFVATLSAQISNYADRFLLSALWSAEEAGLYSLAYNLAVMGVFYWGALVSDVLTPYATEYHNRQMAAERDLTVNRMIKYSYLTTIPLMAVILGLRTELLQVLAESEYAASASIVPVLLFVPLAIVLAAPSSLILRLQGRTKVVAVINIVGMVTNILLNVLLIPKYAMLGAAWASIISFFTVMLLGYLSVRGSGIVSLRLSKIPQLLAVNVVLCMLTYGARCYLQASGYDLGLTEAVLLLGGGGLAVYLILVWLLKIVNIEEIGHLRELVGEMPE